MIVPHSVRGLFMNVTLTIHPFFLVFAFCLLHPLRTQFSMSRSRDLCIFGSLPCMPACKRRYASSRNLFRPVHCIWCWAIKIHDLQKGSAMCTRYMDTCTRDPCILYTLGTHMASVHIIHVLSDWCNHVENTGFDKHQKGVNSAETVGFQKKGLVSRKCSCP